MQYLLECGALLHRIPRPRGSTTDSEICNLYCSYVHRKYGNAIVVFDGHDEMATKNVTQQRRTGEKAGATVTFSESIKVTLQKEVFLYKYAEPVSSAEQLSSISSQRVLIVKTAVKCAQE